MTFKVVTLGKFATIQGGYAYKSGDFQASGNWPVLKIKNVRAGSLDYSEVAFVSDHIAETTRNWKTQIGDVLISMTGSGPSAPASLVGRVGRVQAGEPIALINQRVGRLTIKNGVNIHPSFLYHVLSLKETQQFLVANATGSANQVNISAKTIEAVPCPDIDYQTSERVSDFLDAIENRIALLRQTNATLEAIAQALFKSWFVDFDPVLAKAEGRLPEGIDAATAELFPEAFEESELGMVPKGWQVVPFLDVCDLLGGSQPPAAVFIDELKDGYVRLLQIRDFSTDSHKTYIPDTNKLKKVTEDDVLIGRYGSASGDKAKDSLGRVCRGLSGSYNVALMKLNPLLVGREFALQLVNDPRFYNYLQGVSSKAVQSGFSKTELGQYQVVLPSPNIALKFEELGASVWESVKANNNKIKTFTNLRDTFLPRLISGRLRIADAEAELEKAMA
jgi:type I restriction enzyme S subunit